MRNENIASIIELIHSGNDIYKKAIDNIDNTSLNHVLQDLLHVREHAALELKPYAIANPQTADDTPVSYTIKAREVYSDVMKEVSSDKESMYLEQLEGVESKVLKEIENVITAQPEQADNAVLLKVRSDIKSCKEKLSNISLIS
ncbi:PA2169 family four-helix-bundle protein [Vibrio parahaemolyticus]|uniref:DUF2383 domain-containing protein n=1 Tax=Vibrio parahaemolyticus TaxID=670 RepID=A0A7Z2RMN7_VIBPH|nr:PA2169 family four-helix-bundle protein [Vibrio parahaemolyticus]EHK0751371.1 PA2169 family four-helix-bundle protein [Vibrio parahaemolyticus]EKH9209972.1 PA2169 family four-helix-bundle protein [Vibrio parahaemolyticus]MBY4654804.1 PA2169 family four-helix-bundle protein [Vibrio parahaemolyticus]MCR9726116.1 PA2169 family four-helix-bundle protein [Vibrio parahaemolyticus]MCR9743155.1 PA2169 family four-helix-bundle protein [Vibrio parahaemolyticus]